MTPSDRLVVRSIRLSNSSTWIIYLDLHSTTDYVTSVS